MKRKGFTLSEILIALAIVGSVAAISIPMVHRIMPDKDKAVVLKVFKMVNEINDELINNPTLYRFGDGTNCQHILACYELPSDGNHQVGSNTAYGYHKYPILLAEHLNLSVPLSMSSSTYIFTTSDGVFWRLIRLGNFVYILQIDTNNPQRDNCGPYSSTCRNPRRFQFLISNDAIITGNDPLTQAYLENPDDLSDRQRDLQRAAELSSQHP